MAKFSVTIPEVESASKKLMSQADDYEQAATTLKTAADNLMGSWKGDASEAFARQEAEAYNWYKQMANVVRQYAVDMQYAASKYVEADIGAAGIVRKG